MSFEFKLPDIGEGVSEGEIVEWHVALGDVVSEDDPMVEVMTDKATVTIGAPKPGTIADLRFQPGEVAQVGQVIVVIATEGGAAVAPAKEAEKKDEGPAATAVGDIREGLPGTSFFQPQSNGGGIRSNSQPAAASGSTKGAAPAARASGRAPVDFFQAKPMATPATRKLARDLGLDLRRVPPSGPGGRTTRDDVKGFADGAPSAGQPPSASAPRQAAQPIVAPQR